MKNDEKSIVSKTFYGSINVIIDRGIEPKIIIERFIRKSNRIRYETRLNRHIINGMEQFFVNAFDIPILEHIIKHAGYRDRHIPIMDFLANEVSVKDGKFESFEAAKINSVSIPIKWEGNDMSTNLANVPKRDAVLEGSPCFTRDYALLCGIVIEYREYNDTLFLYPVEDGTNFRRVSTKDFVTETKWKWLEENVQVMLQSIYERYPSFSLSNDHMNDIMRMIIQLTHRYDDYRVPCEAKFSPLIPLPGTMLTRFTKVIEVHSQIHENVDENVLEVYQKERIKFIKKYNWNTYHYLVNACRAFDFNLNKYGIQDFNTFMKNVVDYGILNKTCYEK